MNTRVAVNAYEDEISKLIAQMTVAEKLDQLDEDIKGIDFEKIPEPDRSYCKEHLFSRNSDARTNNIIERYALEHTRLKIPFLIHEEGLHGLYRADSTIFPQQMTLGSTFEPELARKMGEGIASEGRTKGIQEVWAPVLDLARDPRWGRTEETFGEDTYLSSKMGAAVVRGMQGDDKSCLKDNFHVLSELKHFTAYGNPIGGLNCAPTTMGRHDSFAYCMPVFEEAIKKAGAFNVMASYNSIDGVPVIADKNLLTEMLRDEWGMPGLVRSDMLAIAMQHTAHYTCATQNEALRNAVKAGVDVQLYDYSHEEYRRLMNALLQDGEITMEDLDKSVARVLRCKFALGLFENPFVDETLEAKTVHCQKHKDTALEIARKGAVLLKNQDNILPLSKDIKKIALLGPNATQAVMGDYHVEPSFKPVTLADGLRALLPQTEVLIEKGCNIMQTGIHPIESWWMKADPRPDHGINEGDSGFTGEYFNGEDFSGVPVLTRIDSSINFNWIMQKPDEAIDSSKFCVRWSGRICLDTSFSGRLGLSTSDSMRLYLDDKLIVDGWGKNDANVMVPCELKRGQEYAIKIEFRNDARAPRVIFGYDLGEENFEKAVSLAKQADIAIVALGESNETSGENFDRTTLELPGSQLDFLKAIYMSGTPVVLVLNTGRPVSCVWEQENIQAILQAGFNGELGGQAVAEILFGDVNPSGRLSMSYPKSIGQIPCHYSRKPAGGRKYVEMDWNPLYPFGFGLSYTEFAYSDLVLSSNEIAPDGELTVSFTLKNVGTRQGEEVAQLYIRDCFTSMVRPTLELKGFQKVSLMPNESVKLSFKLGFSELKMLNGDYNWVVEPGEFKVMVGRNSSELLLNDKFFVTSL